MSLLPILLDDTSRLFDQHFGHGIHPEDIFASWGALRPSSHYRPAPHQHPRDYYRPWRSIVPRETGSAITVNKDKFQVCLDVQQFTPEEIVVKMVGNQVVVEGKHEEKEDEHGFVSRHFVRKYQLPEGYRSEDVVSSLSSDGVLSVTAPRHKPEAVKEGERLVPITATGPAHTTVKKQPQHSGNDSKMEQ